MNSVGVFKEHPKTPSSLSCFLDVISASNGNHVLNANTTSSMSTPAGSCDAPSDPVYNYTLHPTTTTSDVASFVSRGVSSSAQNTLLLPSLFLFPFSSACSCCVI